MPGFVNDKDVQHVGVAQVECPGSVSAPVEQGLGNGIFDNALLDRDLGHKSRQIADKSHFPALHLVTVALDRKSVV